MQKVKQANFKPFDASDWAVGIVVAQFNKDVNDKLLASALSQAKNFKIKSSNLKVAKVVGCIEIPLVLEKLASSGKYNALLALGSIIKGETPHFDYVSKFVTEGILRVQLDYRMPIGFGILTCNTLEQAETRAHLGGDYLAAVLHQARLIQEL